MTFLTPWIVAMVLCQGFDNRQNLDTRPVSPTAQKQRSGLADYLHGLHQGSSIRMTAIEEIARFREVPLSIEVEMDRCNMTVRAVLGLRSGSIIAMKKSAGENLDILVGGARIGSGEIVVLDNMMAVRITNLEKPGT